MPNARCLMLASLAALLKAAVLFSVLRSSGHQVASGRQPTPALRSARQPVSAMTGACRQKHTLHPGLLLSLWRNSQAERGPAREPRRGRLGLDRFGREQLGQPSDVRGDNRLAPAVAPGRQVMYNRAERRTGIVHTSTPAEVGPGSYLRTDRNAQVHGYAPFGSTAARTLTAVSKEGPGPGAYTAPPVAGGTGRGVAGGAGQPFKSRVPRFAVERSVARQAPGPGEYTLPSSLASKGTKIAPAPDRIWVRAKRLSLSGCYCSCS